MGHLVNPISFRLGITQSWIGTWFKLGNRTNYISHLKEDLTSLKYIEYFFYYFKLLKKVDNNVLESQLEQLFYLRPSQVKRFKVKYSVFSTFIRNISLIFSHVSISRYKDYINFLIHFYDASIIIGSDSLVKFKISRFNKRRRRFINDFIPIRFRFIKFRNRFLNIRRRRLRFIDVKKFLHSIVTREDNNLKFFLFEKGLASIFFFKKHFYSNFFFCINQLKILLFLFSFKYLNKIAILFIVRCIIFLLYSLFVSLRICIKKYIKYFRYSVFSFYSVSHKFINLSLHTQKNYLLYKCNYFLRLLSILLMKFIYFLFKNNTFIKDKQVTRKFYSNLVFSRLLYKDLKTILCFNYNSYFIKFFFLNNKNVTANFLCNYFVKKLSQKYTIFEILNPVVRDLKRNLQILGFKMSCAGRLTKKQRAGLIVQRFNSVPLNTIQSIVDYSMDTVILRHGVSCIKIWLHKSVFFKPFYFSLEYHYV